MKILVTGGGGFLGLAVTKQLLQRGDSVRCFCRGTYAELDQLEVETHRGDLADAAAVSAAVSGCDAVIHVGAKAGIWGSYKQYYSTNVVGTENVLSACREHGVQRLVYTSTPSVIFSSGGVEGADESIPYAEQFETHYPKTKAIAEKLVLEANDSTLWTVAIRPHLIWGPGDNHLVPRILAKGRDGSLRHIGKEAKLVDTVYIDNAAAAHLLALDRLKEGAVCGGKAYFITQGEPISQWEIIDRILAAGGLPPVKKRISSSAAYAVGAVLEFVHWVLGLEAEPRVTRFSAQQLSSAHWYDISAARRDLGYQPTVSLEEGLERLKQHLSEPQS